MVEKKCETPGCLNRGVTLVKGVNKITGKIESEKVLCRGCEYKLLTKFSKNKVSVKMVDKKCDACGEKQAEFGMRGIHKDGSGLEILGLLCEDCTKHVSKHLRREKPGFLAEGERKRKLLKGLSDLESMNRFNS